VRFGNVLGSSGSVVPIFRRQIARGGPMTVTDERMTRYFMTIPEAVQLIIRSGSLGDLQARAARAEVFVLDMGEPVRIIELARAMIELSGLDPDHDIEIEIVGVRGGEKLHEQLFNSYERSTPTVAEKILLAEREPLAVETVEAMFDEIGLLVLEGDAAGLAAKVSELSATRGNPEAATPDHEAAPSNPGAAFVPGPEGPSPPVTVMPTPAPSTSETPGVEEVSGLDGDRDRRGAPAPLIHSRDS
jgi:FlaA1/EpsC-like NDP-sugar epimerase